jgi:hypothetical protein
MGGSVGVWAVGVVIIHRARREVAHGVRYISLLTPSDAGAFVVLTGRLC